MNKTNHPSGVACKQVTNFLDFNLGSAFNLVMSPFFGKTEVLALKTAMGHLEEHWAVCNTAGFYYTEHRANSMIVLRRTPEWRDMRVALLTMAQHEPDLFRQRFLISMYAYLRPGLEDEALAFSDIRSHLQALIQRQEDPSYLLTEPGSL